MHPRCHNLTITFIPTRGDSMRFRVGSADGQVKPQRVRRERDWQDQPTPVVPALNMPSAPKRKPGRPGEATDLIAILSEYKFIDTGSILAVTLARLLPLSLCTCGDMSLHV